MKTKNESYQNYIKELELEKMDLIGKINALDNRLEFDEISTKQYNLLVTPLKKELESLLVQEVQIKETIKIKSTKQINRLFKLTKYVCKLALINKISFKKYYLILNSISFKADRLHSLSKAS